MGKSTGFEGELDHAGNPCCGQSFMAGTICTLPPGHDGGCAPICQCCGKDWYMDACECWPRCEGCDERVEEGNRFCETCACPQLTPQGWCQLPDDHEGPHDTNFQWERPCASPPPSNEEVADAIASIQTAAPPMQ